VQPSTIHADTQGQSLPVFSLAHLLGFELMPRIRNWKDLNFYRPARRAAYVHIDALFGEPGQDVIDFDLIEAHFRDLMRVAISVREASCPPPCRCGACAQGPSATPTTPRSARSGGWCARCSC